ncbi:lytic transglycosylase domain-containing protein [Streptomyces luteoverticillatus]|uniref:Lytic transglycosylase domain-containing protein n=1 Tax=Streptomyces luteoverticillatus TaxID=66425 RepID=A0A3S9PCL3_STRLT|nr:transglycosylase SLT domain-containing protein [Streptomyces luteoverticillatus]AZQ70134.1 lytic transglycosylase domain-containing protein [Streptomyces luteoverticillatus]
MAARRPLMRLVAAVVVTAAAAGALTACGGTGDRAAPPPASASPGAPGGSSPSANQDPARFAPQVVKYAGRAKIDAQLLMAILYNESYKPHDPALERAWQRMKPDSAFGIANMHKAAFDDTKQGRDFANRSWDELPDDPGLAVEAAAWFLHDLASQLPGQPSGPYTRNELLALGYNAGAGNMGAFARGAKPGPQAQSYLDRLRANWAKAGQAVKR